MNWLNDFNSTNGKIIAGIFMAIEVVTTVCLMEVAGKHFNEILLLEVLTFIAAWAGISYVQFAKKRDTFKPALPADEDGPSPPRASVLSREDTQLAADALEARQREMAVAGAEAVG